MLATSTYMSNAPHAFLPTIPSPLSPCSANIYGRQHSTHMSSLDEKANKSANEVPFSKRPVKKAPSPKQDGLKERRRKLFLKKVQDGREEKRFEARGEDIMRLDYFQRKKQWEAEQARAAPDVPSDPLEEEEDEELYDLPTSSGNAMQISAPSTQQPRLDDEVDEVLQREDEELEALLEYMPGQDDVGLGGTGRDEHLWSDDDDYDALFSEFMQQDGMQVQQQQRDMSQPRVEEDEAMDLS